MKITPLLLGLLVGCSQVVYPKRSAKIVEQQSTEVPGTCRFETQRVTDEKRWSSEGANYYAWTAPCDSFKIGDTVVLEIRR